MSKRFFTKHAKSSAMMVSLAIHGILLVVALSFVAVTVIKKEDQVFETKKMKRPKVPLKKLQVPVDIKKKKPQKPKLRKRIVVQPKLNNVPDIKMPEISGVKGGMGSAGYNFGGGGSLGFTLPEINIFGLKSKGEKVFLILDCGPGMMSDARGGIPAFNIIKNELLAIVETLPATTVFNLSVYSKNDTYLLFPSMRASTPDNVARARAWLEPLNRFKPGMGNKEYGPRTLGPGGTKTKENPVEPPLRYSSYWLRPALFAMKQQADAVYVLTEGWGRLLHVTDTYAINSNWDEDDAAKWQVAVAKGKEKYEEENRQRREKGLPPKVLHSTSPSALARHYFPNVRHPPKTVGKKKHTYSPAEIEEGMKAVRKKHGSKGLYEMRNGTLKRKDKFSFNVIHFTTKGNNAPIGQFKALTGDLRGRYKRLEGLAAIRFSASSAPEADLASEEPPAAEQDPAPTVMEQPQASEQETVASAAEQGSAFPMDPILGKWKFKFEGDQNHKTREFTADRKCIQRNHRGKKEWQSGFSMTSATAATTGRGDMVHELQADGTLRFLYNVIATRVD